jgi:hypothetical protein
MVKWRVKHHFFLARRPPLIAIWDKETHFRPISINIYHYISKKYILRRKNYGAKKCAPYELDTPGDWTGGRVPLTHTYMEVEHCLSLCTAVLTPFNK